MEEVSLILGIVGTGGAICAIVLYVLSNGVKSKCRVMKTALDIDIHTVTREEEDKEQALKNNSLANLSRVELEELIANIIAKSANNISSRNIIIPINNTSGSFHEDKLKEIINHRSDSPYTRSRSDSEESHRSHKSHRSQHSYYSKGKEDIIHIMKEEI